MGVRNLSFGSLGLAPSQDTGGKCRSCSWQLSGIHFAQGEEGQDVVFGSPAQAATSGRQGREGPRGTCGFGAHPGAALLLRRRRPHPLGMCAVMQAESSMPGRCVTCHARTTRSLPKSRRTRPGRPQWQPHALLVGRLDRQTHR